MGQMTGAQIVARSLKQQGVEYMFGIVGVPVIPIAIMAQREGIKYYGFRNEQSASYAAAGRRLPDGPAGRCLGVSGPGMIHCIAGAANAWSNCWPMLMIGGANDIVPERQGAFQEAPQIEAARPFVKYAAAARQHQAAPVLSSSRRSGRRFMGAPAPRTSTCRATSSPDRWRKKSSSSRRDARSRRGRHRRRKASTQRWPR